MKAALGDIQLLLLLGLLGTNRSILLSLLLCVSALVRRSTEKYVAAIAA